MGSIEVDANNVPVVSVVMSVYNGERYLREAIDSILEQSFRKFEFIIVDDGSMDASAAIVNGYEDPRIVRITNPANRGLAYSLNRGLKLARGEFVARQDADDISLPDRLYRQVSLLQLNETVGLIGTGSKWIDDRGGLVRVWNPPTNPKEIQQKILRALPVLHATIMFRLNCLKVIDGFYDESYPVAQDTDFLLRFSEAWDISNISDTLYVVRQHMETTSSKRGGDQQKYLNRAQLSAINRRISFGWSRLGVSRSKGPDWVQNAERRWLAERYVWWSACSRTHSKSAALQLLLIAQLLDPTTPDIWIYLKGIAGRKLGIRGRASDQTWFA
ncbi:MAG: glycosyltransferase family A protein [Candidatus Promineifilaceae bacterium]